MNTRILHNAGEHRYHVAAAIAIALVVLAGFVPMFTMRLQRHDPNLTWFVLLHGLSMASWIALFLTQTLLIARHRVELHRRLGLCGVALAILILLTGLPTLFHGAARQSHDVHSAQFLWMLLAFDGLALLVFTGLAAAAIALRRHGDWHKRLMLLATLSLLGPAFGRLTEYARLDGPYGDVAVLLLCIGCVVACAGVDGSRQRRLHPALAYGGSVVIAMFALTYAAKLQL